MKNALLALCVVLTACSVAPQPSGGTLTSKQLLLLMDAQLWEVPASALNQTSQWTLHVQRYEKGELVGEQPYPLSWKAGEVTAAGVLLRERRESDQTRVLATTYRFAPRERSTTLDSLGIAVDTTLTHAVDTLVWDASAPRFQTLATYGLYRAVPGENGTTRYDSLEWNDQTRASAEFQALPSVVVVTLERL